LVDILILDDDRFLVHETGPRHLECPERLLSIREALAGFAPPGLVRRPVARPATTEQLLRVHTPAHLAALEATRGTFGAFDHETPYSPGSVDAAYLAAGGAVEAVAAVATGEARRAFALVRPPGHHAEEELAMGFCLVNNVAVAAAHAAAALGRERILIVDWDAHHGNGTQHAFYARRDVLVFSLHRFPYFPGTGGLEENGRDAGRGFTVNVPLPPKMGDGDYATALVEVLEPIADEYRPDLVIVSAGFDAHRDDPEGGMAATESGFQAMAAIVAGIADRHAEGRLALVLEGGYHPPALGRCVRAVLEILAGAPAPPVPPASPRGAAAIRRAREFHRRYWTSL
jgi:acetoin utilization deacetylase AcuC-like enzyme